MRQYRNGKCIDPDYVDPIDSKFDQGLHKHIITFATTHTSIDAFQTHKTIGLDDYSEYCLFELSVDDNRRSILRFMVSNLWYPVGVWNRDWQTVVMIDDIVQLFNSNKFNANTFNSIQKNIEVISTLRLTRERKRWKAHTFSHSYEISVNWLNAIQDLY